jgi:5'-nucleotidase
MTHFLLTNDDGVDSPALVPFARALALGDNRVTVVVPDRERSWVGKAITRLGDVSVRHTERDGVDLATCSGYPADAAQIGIHVECDTRPDALVSGINLGFNHGTAFLMSSGTVGAAIEGWISGIPAVAFSTGRWGAGYDAWRRHAESSQSAGDWAALATTCAVLLDEIRKSGLLDHADVISVNLPFDATPATPRRITRIARVGYDRLFREVGAAVYRHEFSGITEFEALDGSDVAAARDGAVSITPVRLPQAAEVPDGVRKAIEGTRA